MVDGIYWIYTEMAVKQFQNAKVIKVTGKVDEETAIKLGLIKF
ncbi:MAG: peptidoglycan-binding domain-containing protein [Methanobrevibacter sp.]|nr:peptidoglycan-binding domain-containing protein [Methanobrevibacter sp.]